MRLYRLEETGDAVRDIQQRLRALGYSTDPDPEGSFGPSTHEAVLRFQRARGLSPDGVVGPETWRELVEAGYRPGDRLLYLRRPMLRGDDVAELQRRLNALGFDAGKVDGIFGPDTLRALLEFQQNRGMAEDGIAGPEVLEELRKVARATSRTGREAVREREWLRALPTTVVGRRIFVDPGYRDEEEGALAWDAASAAARRLQAAGAIPLLSRSADTPLSERIRARRANRLGADVVIAFRTPGSDVEGAFFFASALSRSEVGARLASELGRCLGLPTDGRAAIILKETRAPAVMVVVETLGSGVGERSAEAVTAFFRQPR